MSRTVKAGATGVDISFARPPGARLVELGCTFGVGYISVRPASPAKNLTRAECDDYLLYIFLLLVWEMTAARPNLGAIYGTQDGTNAAREAAVRGCPVDVPILVACDTNTTAANVNAQEAYMRAFAVACAPYPIGIYGDVDILYRCADLWKIGWLPNAWSWSGGSRAIAEATARALGVHVLQHTGYYIDGTWAVDPDECIADFPAWGLGTDPIPQPVEATDMPAFCSNKTAGKYGQAASPQGGCTIWVLDHNTKSALSFEAWVAYGQPFGTACDDSVLDGIPDYVAPVTVIPPVVVPPAIIQPGTPIHVTIGATTGVGTVG